MPLTRIDDNIGVYREDDHISFSYRNKQYFISKEDGCYLIAYYKTQERYSLFYFWGSKTTCKYYLMSELKVRDLFLERLFSEADRLKYQDKFYTMNQDDNRILNKLKTRQGYLNVILH